MNILRPAALAAAMSALTSTAMAAAAPDTLGSLALSDLSAIRASTLRPRPVPVIPGFTVRLDASGAREQDGEAVGTARLIAALDLFADQPRPARIEATLLGQRDDRRAQLRLLGGRARGWWGGVAVERERGETTAPLFGLGAWARRRVVVAGASVSQYQAIRTSRFVDMIDSTAYERIEADQVLRTAARGSLRWTGRDLEVETGAGLAFEDESVWRWADVRLTVWPMRSLGIVATASSPAPVGFESPSAEIHRASLGVRLDPWRAASPRPAHARTTLECVVEDLGGGRVALEVHAPGAGLVEVMGDFTGWSPRPLLRVAPRRPGLRALDAPWQIELQPGSGAHRVSLRIDGGAWLPPPGLPTALDEFGGVVGLLVVP
jgi:hypothetical protein